MHSYPKVSHKKNCKINQNAKSNLICQMNHKMVRGRDEGYLKGEDQKYLIIISVG